MKRPIIGDIVHYRKDYRRKGEVLFCGDGCEAAIVLRVYEDRVQVNVFFPVVRGGQVEIAASDTPAGLAYIKKCLDRGMDNQTAMWHWPDHMWHWPHQD